MGGKPVWRLCPREDHLPGYPVKGTSQKERTRHPFSPTLTQGAPSFPGPPHVLEMRPFSFPQLAALCVSGVVFTSQKSPSVTIETGAGVGRGGHPLCALSAEELDNTPEVQEIPHLQTSNLQSGIPRNELKSQSA